MLAQLPPPPAGRLGWPWTEETSTPAAGADGPRITVVTPSFNQGRFLEHTIRSVLLQNYPNLEYIVIDGGSTDESRAIIDKYRAWLAATVSEPDAGQADALNKGFAKASGAIHAYLNSDDFYLPGALHAVARHLPEPPQPCLVAGACDIVDEQGRRLYTHRGSVRTFADLADLWGVWHRDGYLPQPAVFWWWPEGARTWLRPDLHYVMDYELWGRLLQAQVRVVHIEEPIAAFRTYAAQKSASSEALHREVLPLLAEWLRSGKLDLTRRVLVGADVAYARIRQRLSSQRTSWRRRVGLTAALLARPSAWLSRQLARDVGHAAARTARRLRGFDRVFRRIKARNAWGGGESVSGPGSALEQTATIRAAIPQLLAELGCRIMLDAPCGDFHWLSQMALPAEYWGCDIVEGLIARNTAKYGSPRVRFFRADISRDPLPRADLILCRDCLVHLPDEVVHRVLENFVRSGSRYLLTTTFPDHEAASNIAAGEWRPLNLQQSPFNLTAPLRLINEHCTEGGGAWRDKSLGLWDIEALAHRARRP
jgi:hypothetical protein